MNLWRWVDPRVQTVQVADVRAYLLGHGWRLEPDSGPDLLEFACPADDAGEPIVQVLPTSERFRDYQQRLVELITSLSVIEKRHPVEVLNDILPQKASSQAKLPTPPYDSGAAVAPSMSGSKPA